MPERVNPDDPFLRDREEVERAAQFYYGSALQRGIDARTKQLVIERCAAFISGPAVLDLGFVDGSWTDAALARDASVDIVEGAAVHAVLAERRYKGQPAVRVFHALFQEFSPDRRYDTVIAGDMLRYVPDDGVFLRRVRDWIAPGGHLIVTVPNRRSLHRRIGALMGLEASPDEPNARDREMGNRRSYDQHLLEHLLRQSGFAFERVHGCFLKPLSSMQMQDWSDDLLRAFLLAGDQLQDYCWFLYAIARPSTAMP